MAGRNALELVAVTSSFFLIFCCELSCSKTKVFELEGAALEVGVLSKIRINRQATDTTVDMYQLCPFWGSVGECSKNSIWMNRFCPASCSRVPALQKNILVIACTDYNDSCRFWSQAGECSLNVFYMLWQCVKSCGLCDKPGNIIYPKTLPAVPSDRQQL